MEFFYSTKVFDLRTLNVGVIVVTEYPARDCYVSCRTLYKTPSQKKRWTYFKLFVSSKSGIRNSSLIRYSEIKCNKSVLLSIWYIKTKVCPSAFEVIYPSKILEKITARLFNMSVMGMWKHTFLTPGLVVNTITM